MSTQVIFFLASLKIFLMCLMDVFEGLVGFEIVKPISGPVFQLCYLLGDLLSKCSVGQTYWSIISWVSVGRKIIHISNIFFYFLKMLSCFSDKFSTGFNCYILSNLFLLIATVKELRFSHFTYFW